jgi:hypothetical protein
MIETTLFHVLDEPMGLESKGDKGINALVDGVVVGGSRVTVPNVPVNDRHVLSNFIGHLKQPPIETGVSYDEKCIRLLIQDGCPHPVTVAITPIDRPNCPIFSIQLRKNTLGSIVRILDCTTPTRHLELASVKKALNDILRLQTYTTREKRVITDGEQFEFLGCVHLYLPFLGGTTCSN